MAHHLTGLVMHGDNARRMTQRDPRRQIGMLGQQGRQNGLVPMQDEIQRGVLMCGYGKTGNNRCRSTIPAHGVQ